jgi:hypothetical protein
MMVACRTPGHGIVDIPEQRALPSDLGSQPLLLEGERCFWARQSFVTH